MAESSGFQMNRPTIIALLYLSSFLVGITSIVGIILCYIWKGEEHEDWEDSHFAYLIRTFWIFILYNIIGLIGFAAMFLLASFGAVASSGDVVSSSDAAFSGFASFVLVLILFFGAVAVWFAVRAVKSLLAAQKNLPIANVNSWLF